MYKSIFVPEHEIDIANFLTEKIIRNFLNWQKKPLPQSPFWRKETKNNSKELDELAKRYQVELTAVKNLLKIFDQEAISRVLERGYVGIQRVKKENQAKILYEIYHEQLKIIKENKREYKITSNRNISSTENYFKDKKKFKDSLKGIE